MKKELPRFKLGDKVTWTSQAGGNTRTKFGEVVEVVPIGGYPDRTLFKTLYRGGEVGHSRSHETYCVKAKVEGSTRSAKIYWPLVTKLHLVK